MAAGSGHHKERVTGPSDAQRDLRKPDGAALQLYHGQLTAHPQKRKTRCPVLSYLIILDKSQSIHKKVRLAAQF